MAELTREQLAAEVAKLMINPDFARHLTASAPDGSHPIIPAFPSDKVSDVVREIQEAMGGEANIVVHFLNTFTVVPIKMVRTGSTERPIASLPSDTTIGLLVARIAEDARQGVTLTYRIDTARSHRADRAGETSAEVGAYVATVAA